MTKVPVTGLVTDTPDSTGRIRVRLVDGKVVAIPASEKDRVMARAARQPDVSPNNVVVGDCGSSHIELAEKANDHPVRMTTGFTVVTAAISYGWEATITGPSFAYTYDASGGLAFRTSWEGSYDSPRDQLQGRYSAAVVPDFSYAILWTGDICVSGGPTDERLLTSPDTPISMPLSFSRNGLVARPAAPGSGTDTEGSSPAFPGSVGQATPSAVAPFAGPTRVSDTTVYPYRAIAALQITDQNGATFPCTGFFISADTIATAGHCLYFAGVWARTVRVTPGQDAGIPPPFGTCQGTTAYTTTGWVINRDQRYDYGAVKLNCQTGGQTGWFGLRWTSAPLTGTSITITGYPVDQAPTGSMWTNSGTISSDEERRVFYRILVGDGESGSPVYVPGCGLYCALAVHAYAPPIAGHPGEWGGTRITQAAFDNYQNWRS
jgi:glutamyl endopeptidase